MMVKRRNALFVSGVAVTTALALMLTGCGSSNEKGTAAGGDKAQTVLSGDTTPKTTAIDMSPVTLKVFFHTGFDDKDIQSLIVEPVSKKYPNITVKVVRTGTGTTIQELIASNDVPDILFTWNGDLGLFKELGLLEDLSPVVNKVGLDLKRFDPTVLDAIRTVTDNQLSAIPFAVNFNATYYNKDIFDKFGVAYPKDGMFWEDLIPIAEKLSRTENGIRYRGLDPENINRMSMPLSLTMLDSKTDKPLITSDQWKNVFELAKRIWDIPNNKPDKLNGTGRTQFMNDKNVAMLPVQNILNLGLEAAEKNGLNWDMAQYPSYKSKPNVYGHVDTHIFAISRTSKYKDQAMQLLEVITSDAVQRQSTRTTARLSSLKDMELRRQLGADMAFLKGKHLEAVFKSSPAPAPGFSTLENSTRPLVQKGFEAYFNGTDLNTALRNTEAEINQMVSTARKK